MTTSMPVRRRRAAALAFLLCTTAAPVLAGPREVQMEGDLDGSENTVDSYEIKCTQASSYLCVTLVLGPAGESPMQMTGIATAPNNIVGQSFLRQVGPWARSKTTCFVRPPNPGTIRALVSVGGTGFVPVPDSEYTIKAECAVGGFGADPFASTKTTITRKQDG